MYYWSKQKTVCIVAGLYKQPASRKSLNEQINNYYIYCDLVSR